MPARPTAPTARPVPTEGSARFAALTADLGVLYGGDYNPEQWDSAFWKEDARLMQEAGVNLVTVGVFSWASYEPRPGVRDFGWLQEVLDLLHDHGVAVDLATPTASPPAWLGVLHPDTLPVDADGVRLVAGSRNHFSPASRVYREHALAITSDLVERFAPHPAVRMWHVGNELGQVCYGEESAEAFRTWLRARYGTVDRLNEAWGTAFWSQRYDTFDEVLPPRRMPYHVNPTQALDFRRYTSDLLLDLYREQRDLIRAVDPVRPVTTNLMGFFPHADYWSWADDVDVVADDAYPDLADPHAPAHAALTQDLMRSLRGGEPWMLMESATSAVSFRTHNLPQTPEASRLGSLQAVARGADGVCFFQWRASRAGAERFHSAMLPHAGPDTRVHREVRRLGADLRTLRAVVGGRVQARVAALWDWPSWWATSGPALPTDRLDALAQLRAWYRPLWEDGVAVDIARPGADLAGYDVVLVPHLSLLSPDPAGELAGAVHRGATLVVGPFSGVLDEDTHVVTGRSPALLRDVLGVSGEEWAPLPDGGVQLVPGPGALDPDLPPEAWRAGVLGELLHAEGAEVLATFAEGHLAGGPAVTRHAVGRGAAWYVGTVPSEDLLAAVLRAAVAGAGVEPVLPGLRGTSIEAVRRGDALFLLNHSGAPARVAVPGGHTDLLTGARVDGEANLVPYGAVVLMERNA